MSIDIYSSLTKREYKLWLQLEIDFHTKVIKCVYLIDCVTSVKLNDMLKKMETK